MIVSIWGNSGSGKSTLALRLARTLAGFRKNVILIDTNFVVPQLGVWYPLLDLPPTGSLSNLLQNEITPEILGHKLQLVGDFLGVLGYAKGEPVMNSILQRYDTAAVLLTTAAGLADFVLVDCQTNITQDLLTFVSLEMSSCKFIVCTPDLLALSFMQSNLPMLKDEKYHLDAAYRVFNKVKAHSPVQALENRAGPFHFLVPYDEAVELDVLNGSPPKKRTPGTKRFDQALHKMVYELLERNMGEGGSVQ